MTTKTRRQYPTVRIVSTPNDTRNVSTLGEGTHLNTALRMHRTNVNTSGMLIASHNALKIIINPLSNNKPEEPDKVTIGTWFGLLRYHRVVETYSNLIRLQ